MTRYANIARKRTYVEASFDYNPPDDTKDDEVVAVNPGSEQPPKKKRKRGKRPKAGDEDKINLPASTPIDPSTGAVHGQQSASVAKMPKTKKKKQTFKGEYIYLVLTCADAHLL